MVDRPLVKERVHTNVDHLPVTVQASSGRTWFSDMGFATSDPYPITHAAVRLVYSMPMVVV